MIAQHDLARCYTGNGFHAFANFLPDAGGELRWTQRAGQVKMHRHLAAVDLHLVEQPHFAQRAADFGVTRRACGGSHGLRIKLSGHRVGVPAMPVSWAVLAYSLLRWAISSFSRDF